MATIDIIKIKRGFTAGATPAGLTLGEIAVNLGDGQIFVGGTFGNAIPCGSAGSNGAAPIASHSVTGVASFDYDFVIGSTGHVGLTGNLVRSVNGMTGDVTLSGLPSVAPLATSSLTGVASFGYGLSVSAVGSVSLTSSYVSSINGLTGAASLSAGSNITLTVVGQEIVVASSGGGVGGFVYGSTAPSIGITHGYRWMDSDTGYEYVYAPVVSGGAAAWVQPSFSIPISTPVLHSTTGITSASYILSSIDYYVGVNYAGAVAITLPENPQTGREVIVKDESGQCGAGGRSITISGFVPGDTIDNNVSAVLSVNNGALHFIYRSGWRLI